jgi:hypothetical protein
MLSILPRRRARIECIDAEAEALIRDFREEAYSEAQRREDESSSDAVASDWGRVALAVADKIRTRVDLDPSTRIAMNALFVPDRELTAAREPRAHSEHGPVNELKRTLSPNRQRFRIQFVCATPDREQSVLKELVIHVADRSAAIITAAKTAWPPHTIGLRILDREGHEVFARQKAVQQ